MPEITDYIAELAWRGLVHQCTDEPGMRAHLASPRRIYAGFDPTADSLTIGNLVPIMMLAHAKRAGHTPVVIMGGGTGMIGDPSGKSAERQLMTTETIAHHVDMQRPIFENVLSKVDGPDFTIVNNAEWLTTIGYLEMLRDVGKHFSVNMMIQKESVKARLENREQGISYTEFSYMILQAYDFLRLYKDRGVTVQVGGSDQFGNIVAGIDLIRRTKALAWSEANEDLFTAFKMLGSREEDMPVVLSEGLKAGKYEVGSSFDSNMQIDLVLEAIQYILNCPEHERAAVDARMTNRLEFHSKALSPFRSPVPFGLTAPLVQKADGGKFGKTESGAVWLTGARTSPYAYHQFWLNCSDEDVIPFLKTFTFLPKDEIDALAKSAEAEPFKREAQKRLADEATTILHGDSECARAKAAGRALFSGDLADLDERTLREVFEGAPSSELDRVDLEGDGYDPVALLTSTGLAKSNREAREFLSEGSVSVNGRKLGPDDRVTPADLLHGSMMALRRGKKTWHLTRWS